MTKVDITCADGSVLPASHEGRGAPIVYVHGSFGGLDSWAPVTALLRDGYEVWTYTRRGYALDAGPGSFASDAADLADVIAAAGGRAHVVGGSHGATVALHAALARPDDIASLTVYEPALYAAGPALADTLDRVRALIADGRFASATRTFLAEVARMPEALLGPADGPEDDSAVRQELPGAVRDLEAMVAHDTDLGRWRDLRVPVLLLQGETTWPPMPATMTALLAALPTGTEHHTFAAQSHFATREAPDEFAAAVREFVRGHPLDRFT